jgi:ATP-dependent helicase/nuclease subunit A
MKMDDATKRQVEAAHPARSTWLAANAGSGKTRVLTDRVARLLLDGVIPQNILCLTYTKAAASEMQNRLFRRLGRWTMLNNTDLLNELMALGVERSLNPKDIDRARTLFARAVEAPGGLKIQTIHSFCASILRRFPLEAGVNPQFVEIDERAQKLLLDEVVETIADGTEHSTSLEWTFRIYCNQFWIWPTYLRSLPRKKIYGKALVCGLVIKIKIWQWTVFYQPTPSLCLI